MSKKDEKDMMKTSPDEAQENGQPDQEPQTEEAAAEQPVSEVEKRRQEFDEIRESVQQAQNKDSLHMTMDLSSHLKNQYYTMILDLKYSLYLKMNIQRMHFFLSM